MSIEDDLRRSGARLAEHRARPDSSVLLRRRSRRGRVAAGATLMVALLLGVVLVRSTSEQSTTVYIDRPGVGTSAPGTSSGNRPVGTVALGAGPSTLLAADGSVLGEVPRDLDASWRDGFTRAATRELLDVPAIRAALADAGLGAAGDDELLALVADAGLRISTTLSPPAQGAAEQLVAAQENDSSAGVQRTIVVLDPGTGRVLALAGRAWPRQAGPTLRPFLMAAALEQGLTADEPIADPPTFEGRMPDGSTYRVGGGGGADATVHDVLVEGSPTAWMQLIATGRLDPAGVDDLVERVGIGEAFNPAVISAPLGVEDVGMVELAGAYQVFANDGRWAKPHLVLRIEGPHGGRIYDASEGSSSVISPTTAAAVQQAMTDRLCCGPGARGPLPASIAPQWGYGGNDETRREAWFVGGANGVVALAWIGQTAPPAPDVNGLLGDEAETPWRALMTSPAGTFPGG